MNRPEKEKYLKAQYLEAAKATHDESEINLGQRRYEAKYSPAMIYALADMAKADVYPDSHFSDEECEIWSLFHTAYAK